MGVPSISHRMPLLNFLPTLPGHIPLPSAQELEAFHPEFSSHPLPELSSYSSERPVMSLAWLKNVFSRTKDAVSEKTPDGYSYSRERASSDLESMLSTDASTLLEDNIPEKKSAAIGARVISDAIIGLSDGLTVPFALTAGLSALGDTKVVIYGGVAELIAGAISMGLGGYLGAKSEE